MPPVEHGGRTIKPSQGNNVYIFPAMGMAILATGARHVPQEAFLTAAKALATQVPESYFADGMLYPARSDIRSVSMHVAGKVAKTLADLGLNRHRSSDWDARIADLAFEPAYR